MLAVLKTVALSVITATTESAGCYLPYLWLKEGRSSWLLLPAAASLARFAWLLILHPTGAARTYAAYGGVYISVAVLALGRQAAHADVVGPARCGGLSAGDVDHHPGTSACVTVC